MPLSITAQDIVYAALLALVFTWLIKTLSRVFKSAITRNTEFNFHPRQLEAVMQRCYRLFPNDNIKFRGETYQRGMQIRVITCQNRTIEGKFIGINHENMACIVTSSSVVAQELDKIEEIDLVEG